MKELVQHLPFNSHTHALFFLCFICHHLIFSIFHFYICLYVHSITAMFLSILFEAVSQAPYSIIYVLPLKLILAVGRSVFFLPPKEIQCIILPVKRFCLAKITAIPYSSPWICFKSKLEILYKVSNLTFLKVGTVEYSFCKNILWLRMPMEK